jgi:hypothetical protein
VGMHDVFEWWAEVWIPAALGLVTVLVGVVAVVVSRNASRLAHRIETMRFEDESRREVEAARLRLAELAGRDARVLLRWVLESIGRRPWFGAVRRAGEPTPPRSPLEVAAMDASVELELSFVPGASELLRLTKFDVENLRSFVPEYERDEPQEREDLRAAIIEARERRMLERIKGWGLDPSGALSHIMRDLRMSEDDPENYLKIGLPGQR